MMTVMVKIINLVNIPCITSKDQESSRGAKNLCVIVNQETHVKCIQATFPEGLSLQQCEVVMDVG